MGDPRRGSTDEPRSSECEQALRSRLRIGVDLPADDESVDEVEVRWSAREFPMLRRHAESQQELGALDALASFVARARSEPHQYRRFVGD